MDVASNRVRLRLRQGTTTSTTSATSTTATTSTTADPTKVSGLIKMLLLMMNEIV